MAALFAYRDTLCYDSITQWQPPIAPFISAFATRLSR